MLAFDWTQLDSCDVFAVATHLISKFDLPKEEVKTLFEGKEDRVVSADGFEVPAYLFHKESFPILKSSKFFQVGIGASDKEMILTLASFRDGGGSFPLVVDGSAKVDCVCDIELPDDDEDKAHIQLLVNDGLWDIVPILEQFSQVTGVHVCFHSNFDGNSSLSDVAPVVLSDGRMHIFTRQRPFGDAEKESQYLEKAFDLVLALEKRGERVRYIPPAKGRGILVRDDKRHILAQILSGNFYFLIPIFWNYEKGKTATVFKKLLVLAWNVHQENETSLALGREVKGSHLDTSSFATTTREWIMKKPRLLQEELKEIDEKVQEMQEKLAVLMREKREKTILYHSLSSSTELSCAIERASSDYEKIMELPIVKEIVLNDGGIHVITGPIDIEGVRIADSYTIRINEHGRMAIWTDTSHHPQAIPHPHINETGSLCFGNSTNAVARAMGEHRYFDTVRYVVEWLVNGYTPELALHRIDEWVS